VTQGRLPDTSLPRTQGRSCRRGRRLLECGTLYRHADGRPYAPTGVWHTLLPREGPGMREPRIRTLPPCPDPRRAPYPLLLRPLYCPCTAPVLPLYCPCTAPVLPLYCPCTAPVLPLYRPASSLFPYPLLLRLVGAPAFAAGAYALRPDTRCAAGGRARCVRGVRLRLRAAVRSTHGRIGGTGAHGVRLRLRAGAHRGQGRTGGRGA
jgi:hypothetical protein